MASFTKALSALVVLVLRLVAVILTIVRLLVVAFIGALENTTSPSKLPPLPLLRRAGLLLLLGCASLGGLWMGARRKTLLDPSPWYPRAGHSSLPPAGSSSSYLTAPFTPTLLADGRKVHHITVATHGEEGLARLVRSASWHGNSVKVLGVGDPRLQKWGVGFGVKVECFLDYARSVGPEDLLLFTDAYDVIMWGSHADVAVGYDAAVAKYAGEPDPVPGGKRPPPRFLVSAESLPITWNGIAYGDGYPDSDVKGRHFPYLNSGTFMGPARDVIDWLGSAPMDMNDNDQAFFNALYLQARTNASLPRVALDHDNDIFLTLTAAPPDREKISTHLKYNPVKRRWKHVATPGSPMVFHSPGWARWKQIDEAWGLAQGRNCCGFIASPLQWPTLAAIALDTTVGSLIAGLIAGIALPLGAVAASRSSLPRALGGLRSKAGALPIVGPLVSGLFGGPGSISAPSQITVSTIVGGIGGMGGGLPTSYSPVSTSDGTDFGR